ncbi:hypothetical protein FRX31_022495, partial [Thalictrum thalictroides]
MGQSWLTLNYGPLQGIGSFLPLIGTILGGFSIEDIELGTGRAQRGSTGTAFSAPRVYLATLEGKTIPLIAQVAMATQEVESQIMRVERYKKWPPGQVREILLW